MPTETKWAAFRWYCSAHRWVHTFGWNVAAGGFHKDQICYYAGGMIPFARTAQERLANNDPRPSLQERYGSHAGYVDTVRKAAARAQAEGFLLPEDAAALITAAEKSAVLR